MEYRNIFCIEGRNVIVTGATSGIGADVSRGFAEAGANVFLIGRRGERLSGLTEELKAYGVKTGYAVCDVSDRAQTASAVKAAAELFEGTIEVLVNCAGVTGKVKVGEMDAAEWQKEIAVNLTGTANMCDAVLPFMTARRMGRIINVASINAFVASQTVPRHAYNASKAAVCGLTTGLAVTYMREGITVNAVCPGLFESEMTSDIFDNKIVLATYNRQVPAGRPGMRGEMNGVILFLAGDAASYITGQAIAVDGGYLNASYL
ncbi:MAG: SDR family oxidoreductase [Oscillospiraceae bacterium]|nr:SDR family oxidoreductase [Oscillospiraceae bacterium]